MGLNFSLLPFFAKSTAIANNYNNANGFLRVCN